MAAHVYLSASVGTKLVDGPDLPPDALMRYRGEVGPDDDPVTFAEKMRAAGHVVRIIGTYKGEAVTLAALEG